MTNYNSPASAYSPSTTPEAEAPEPETAPITFHVIHPDAPTERITVDEPENLLAALQQAVGGYVEVVYSDGDQTLLVNEEAGFFPEEYAYNDLASQKATHVLGTNVRLIGNAVVIAAKYL